jgi:predicted nuclease of predicted toxin-antitoxin system
LKFSQLAFLADQNIHPEVTAFLTNRGLAVTTAEEAGLDRASDSAILKRALDEGRAVLTHDSDFGKLAIAANQTIHGIVYLRPGHIVPERTIGTLIALLETNLDLIPPFIVVAARTADKVRIRVRSV